MRILVFLIAALAVLVPATRAAEPFFKPGDVVALVGGEDMVVAAELGYLETLIQLTLPDHKLKFRSLAREGDTVFEQRRDLNYPKLEDQLDKMGATVVICQFGQMESLAASAAMDGMDRVDAMDKVDAVNGTKPVQEVHKVQPVHEKADALRKAKVREFVAAYEKLIGRLKGKDGARRIVIADPHYFGSFPSSGDGRPHPSAYHVAISELAKTSGILRIESKLPAGTDAARDRIHLNMEGHKYWSIGLHDGLTGASVAEAALSTKSPTRSFPDVSENAKANAQLRDLIAAKNRLWFHYYRPQNWAFLAGDRTNQPSSRDHLDPSKRWFPEELEKFVPLIEAKDAEIWALAKKLK